VTPDGAGQRRHDGASQQARLAAFLLNLSERFALRGYSSSEFHLSMTREDIGSYLGLKLETISRLFSKFQEETLIRVQQRHIRIMDAAGLRKVMSRTNWPRQSAASSGLSTPQLQLRR
jgi:hypothetical protein